MNKDTTNNQGTIWLTSDGANIEIQTRQMNYHMIYSFSQGLNQ